MNTVQELKPQFNKRVITPMGPGYLVGRDADGLLLVCVKQKADKLHSPCRHLWFKPEQVRENSQ